MKYMNTIYENHDILTDISQFPLSILIYLKNNLPMIPLKTAGNTVLTPY